jgi:hypothetical protein
MAKYQDKAAYEAEVIDHAFNETKNGNPMIEMECKVHRKILGYGTGHAEYVPAESNQYPVTVRVVFATEKQRAFNIRKLRYAGWEGKNFEDFDMVGQKIIIINEHQAGEGKNAGKTYDNFDLVPPPVEHKELESKPGIKKKLNALLSKELRETASADSAPPKPRQDAPPKASEPEPDESTPGRYEDDTVPF